MEDHVLPHLHSCFSSWGTTLAQKQQKSATSSPKNNKGINPEYGITQQVLPAAVAPVLAAEDQKPAAKKAGVFLEHGGD